MQQRQLHCDLLPKQKLVSIWYSFLQCIAVSPQSRLSKYQDTRHTVSEENGSNQCSVLRAVETKQKPRKNITGCTLVLIGLLVVNCGDVRGAAPSFSDVCTRCFASDVPQRVGVVMLSSPGVRIFVERTEHAEWYTYVRDI